MGASRKIDLKRPDGSGFDYGRQAEFRLSQFEVSADLDGTVQLYCWGARGALRYVFDLTPNIARELGDLLTRASYGQFPEPPAPAAPPLPEPWDGWGPQDEGDHYRNGN